VWVVALDGGAGRGAAIVVAIPPPSKPPPLLSFQVVHTVDAATIDKQAVYCRCWKSGTFPLCDASHVKHNKVRGGEGGMM